MQPRTEPHMRIAKGFSLVEMLVALAVFGLAVLGLLNLSGENTRSVLVAEERVLAGVVADNRAVEAMLLPAAQLGDADGSVEAGDRAWTWHRTRHATGDDALLRIEIVVREAEGGRIAAERQLFRTVP